MRKKKIQFYLVGLFTGLILISGIFAVFQPIPKTEISDKMTECIEQGGQLSLKDWSWEEDGSEYKIRCLLPARELFFIDFPAGHMHRVEGEDQFILKDISITQDENGYYLKVDKHYNKSTNTSPNGVIK